MIEDLLLDIVKTEESEDARVRESVVQAKEIVDNARKQASSIQTETAQKIRELDKQNVSAANQEADKLCAEIMQNAENQAQAIKDYAQKQSDSVVDMIIRRLEEKYA